MGLELLFLLLPVAALSGWFIGRRGTQEKASGQFARFSADYFKGLNYLLNEQADEAIEVFIRMVEVDGETIDTHLALGNLFRRRGEIDRATRIHQNLIARPTLTRAQRNQALYELGRDYMRGGLLDRAESLFQELADDREWGKDALRQLLDIYQQEKDWEQAIAVARRAGKRTGTLVAHYLCEMAEAKARAGDALEPMKLVKRALAEDKNSVRASLLEGEYHSRSGAYKTAIRALKRVEQQDPDFIPEIIAPLQTCYRGLGKPLEMLHDLRQLLRDHESISVLLALVDLLRQQQGERDAAAFLISYLRKRPSLRGMAKFIELKIPLNAPNDDLLILKDLTATLLEGKPAYACSNCGFSAKTLHWQCPGCKSWNTVRPM